jgi:hypothetical protein
MSVLTVNGDLDERVTGARGRVSLDPTGVFRFIPQCIPSPEKYAF